MGVPSNIIVPFVGVEFDSSQAFTGPATLPIKVILFGQKTASGTGNVLEQILVTNSDNVGLLSGFGSVVHRMAIKYFLNNTATETYIVLQNDAGGASEATTKITFVGTATANGEVDIYISGDKYASGVISGGTNLEVVTALVALINLDPNTPVIATSEETTPASGDFDILVLTAKNKGISAGDLDVRFNFNNGEVLPAGITTLAPVIVAGAVDPDAQDVLDIQGDTWFNIWCSTYTDTTNLAKIEDHLETQAGPLVQKDGMYYFAQRDTRTNLITFATNAARNSAYVTMLPASNRLNSIGEVAASVAARTAESIQDDPAVPLHRMALTGLTPIPSQDRWTLIERNQLAVAGIATLTDDNGVQTESTVTMYLRNSAGAADIAFQFQNTVYILMRLRFTFVQRILLRYPRAKLANDSTRFRSGQQVITPAIGKAEAVAWFREEEAAGQVENGDQFKAQVTCTRDVNNVNKLNWGLPPDLINQFIVGSADMSFRLQSLNN